MSTKPSLLEINGQLYDARTGRLFHHPRGPVIDGFMKKSQPHQVIKKVAGNITPTGPKLTSVKSRTHKPAQTVHQRAQRSKTLMRDGLNKPAPGHDFNSELKPAKARTGLPKPGSVSRAMNMVKNSRVKRFGSPVSQTKSIFPQPAHGKPALRNTTADARRSGSTALSVGPAASMVTSMSHQRLERMLDEALLKAGSHKKALSEHMAGKRRLQKHLRFMPKWLTISLVALVALSAGTYFAWRNVPTVSMKFASVRSQIEGSLPNYIPSGFKFAGPVDYETGTLSMTFTTQDQRSFTLEQKASSLDSSSLKANTIEDDAQVQTSQVKGSTIYLDSSKNEATWVSDGKRYKLRGQLTPDEIFKVAGSVL